LLKHSNKILSNSSCYSVIFNVQNLISALIILFFNFTEKQQQKSKMAISVQHIWIMCSLLLGSSYLFLPMLSIMLMTDYYYKYKVQLNNCTLHTNFSTKNKTYRGYLTPKFLALTPPTCTCSRE